MKPVVCFPDEDISKTHTSGSALHWKLLHALRETLKRKPMHSSSVWILVYMVLCQMAAGHWDRGVVGGTQERRGADVCVLGM